MTTKLTTQGTLSSMTNTFSVPWHFVSQLVHVTYSCGDVDSHVAPDVDVTNHLISHIAMV